MAPNAHVKMQTLARTESVGHTSPSAIREKTSVTRERGRPRKGGAEYKAWLYVENKVHELLGPVQYEAAHDSSPRFPPPRGKQEGTGTGDRTTPFPLQIPPACLLTGVCV